MPLPELTYPSVSSLPTLKRSRSPVRHPRTQDELLQIDRQRVWETIKQNYFKADKLDYSSEALRREVKQALYQVQSDCLAETNLTKFHIEKLEND